MRRPVTASTTASVTTTIDGEPIDDPITSDDQLFLWDSVVTNLNAGETGTLTATAYGYFPVADTIGADDCVSGMMMQTFTLTVTGPGPHLVGPVRTDANATGQVTWKDGLVADEGKIPANGPTRAVSQARQNGPSPHQGDHNRIAQRGRQHWRHPTVGRDHCRRTR